MLNVDQLGLVVFLHIFPVAVYQTVVFSCKVYCHEYHSVNIPWPSSGKVNIGCVLLAMVCCALGVSGRSVLVQVMDELPSWSSGYAGVVTRLMYTDSTPSWFW